jgi:5-methylcytosine-specific restriction enzyme B
MPPKPELLGEVQVDGISIQQLFTTINERIEVLLDRDHVLGHTYFLTLGENPSLYKLSEVFRSTIIPLMQEYFFDDWQKIHWVLNDHRKPREFQFIRQGGETSIQALFGDDALSDETDRRWHVNESAFSQLEAYQLTVSSDHDIG